MPVTQPLELGDRRDHAAERRRGVGEQRRVLLLDAVAGRRVHERDALRDDAARAGGERGVDEVPGPLGPHAVVRVEHVGIREVEPRRQRRELVDDRVGRGVGHGRPHAVGVVDVADDGVGARRLELRGPQDRARHRRHLVPGLEQLRHERGADHARRSGEEHPHRADATAQGVAGWAGMSAFLITGNPGSGKTTIARELSRRGLIAVDADDTAHWETTAGEARRPAGARVGRVAARPSLGLEPS